MFRHLLDQVAAFQAVVARRAVAAWRSATTASVLLLVSGCSASPSQDIMGSFFPSWLLCLGIGIIVAAIVRHLLVLTGVDAFLILPLATYCALALSVTFLVWLIQFGN